MFESGDVLSDMETEGMREGTSVCRRPSLVIAGVQSRDPNKKHPPAVAEGWDQYSDASMMVSTRLVCDRSVGSGVP